MSKFIYAHAGDADWKVALGSCRGQVRHQLQDARKPTLGWCYLTDLGRAPDRLLRGRRDRAPPFVWIHRRADGFRRRCLRERRRHEDERPAANLAPPVPLALQSDCESLASNGRRRARGVLSMPARISVSKEGGADERQIISAFGVAMPRLIYGTAWKKERTAALVELALRQGFRGVDTACQPKHYNEEGVGEGLAAAFSAGLARSEIYVQTKFTPFAGQDPNDVPYDPKASLSRQVLQSFRGVAPQPSHRLSGRPSASLPLPRRQGYAGGVAGHGKPL